MTSRLFSVLRHQCFQLAPRALMLQKGLSGGTEDSGKFGPGIRAAHVADPGGFDPRLRGFDAKEARGVATLDTAPELALGRDDKMLVEGIGMGGDLKPFATAGDH